MWGLKRPFECFGHTPFGRARREGRERSSRPPTALLMIALVLVGLVSVGFLPVSALPDVDYPTIQVRTFYPGASPQVMSTTVTAPLEVQLGEIPVLQQMTSFSSATASIITLQFDLSLNLDVAEQAPSPIRSPSLSSTTSPKWIPTRNSMRLSRETPTLRSTIAFWTSIAHRPHRRHSETR